MGILFNNDYIDHYLWTSYKWLKPSSWYNRVQVNYNAYYSRLFKGFTNQKMLDNFQSFSTNINANAQLKNLWFVGAFIGFLPNGNDFYEAHEQGYSFRTPERFQYNIWFETNTAKKYYANANFYLAVRQLFNSRNRELTYSHRYRFNDKLSISHDLSFNYFNNDAGFYDKYNQDVNGTSVLQNIIFSRRDRTTTENILRIKYNFNNRSGISFRARHYWSKVHIRQLYDLNNDGSLSPTRHNDEAINNQNYNAFNIDAVYTLQFAPGSFLNIVWKDGIYASDGNIDYRYFKNLDGVIGSPQNNNLSIRIIYYLDYLDLKKRKGRG
jgi:Domain of unknown function (DUF5916)